jgi:sec-independent protein translocase protein TatB
MFNIGAAEIAFILVVALLVLGPKRLPEMARGIGKFIREFRRQTDEVRSVVEREFYRMDQELDLPKSLEDLPPGNGQVPAPPGPGADEPQAQLPPPALSQPLEHPPVPAEPASPPTTALPDDAKDKLH